MPRREIVQDHPVHLMPLTVGVNTGRGVELVRLQIQVTGGLRQMRQQLSGVTENEYRTDGQRPEY
jgi:hypothetical protein